MKMGFGGGKWGIVGNDCLKYADADEEIRLSDGSTRLKQPNPIILSIRQGLS